jgi:hypothetical protein
LELLQAAGMVAGLSKYAHGLIRQRGSSPKLQVLNTALMTAQDSRTAAEALLAGTESGSGFHSAPRQDHGCHRSEKRTPR